MSFNVEEICDHLQDADRRRKLRALEVLQQQCKDSKYDTMIQEMFDKCYLHLLKCYSDRFESVRSSAVETVNVFFNCLSPSDFHLVNIVATLVERLGQQETLEESEEIRLIFVQQLLQLEKCFMESGYKRSLQECETDITQILTKVLRDPYPAVQRAACSCVIVLASAMGPHTFQRSAELLAKASYGLLNHKHSQTRIAAVKALSYVALHIDASGDGLSRLISEVSPLLMDSMPLVRRECGEMGIRLLLELRDRYSYFERIIPLVLCCLKDDSPEVHDYIEPLWIKCGKQYYDENEAELSKQEVVDLPLPNYPVNVKRPTIGCRGIVQRSLRLLKLIVRESSDWKENVRLHSLKLLYQFILHAEASMTANFFEIYHDVARACRDVEAVVEQEAIKVADLMGRLLKYEDWYEHGFEGLEKNAKEGYLKCFYHMYKPALGVAFQDNYRLSQILAQPEFSETLKNGFQLYILKTVEMTLDKTKITCDPTVVSNQNGNDNIEDDYIDDFLKNCYVTVIKIMAIALDLDFEMSDNSEIQNRGNNILNLITNRLNLCLDDVHEKYFPNALQFVTDLDAFLDANTEPIILLSGFIKLVKFREPSLLDLQNKINTVFEYCSDESKLKVFSAVTMAMLDWHKTIRRPLEHSCSLLKNFVTSVVEPHLEWHAGASAEAMRALATGTLSSMSQGASEEAVFILPRYAKQFCDLLADQDTATRLYAMKCLKNFGPVPIESLRPLAYACLQRLDDPSSGIRILTASVLPELKPKFSNESMNGAGDSNDKNFEFDIWNSFIKHCVDMLFLHYDGPEIKLQAAIKETILKLCKRYPDICQDSYQRILMTTHNSYCLQELKSELPLNF